MDSQTTLANPSGLIFTRDNPSNTTLLSEGIPVYKVTTIFEKETTTQVSKVVDGGEDKIIASLEWSEVLPDKIKIGDAAPMRINRFLKTGLFMSQTASFKDDQGRKYEWRGNVPGKALQLHASDTTGAIAHFEKSSESNRRAILHLEPRAREILDLCVITFLFLEKRRRSSENSTVNGSYGGGFAAGGGA